MDGEVDHYVMLGLPSGEAGSKLSQDEIKKAYRSKLKVLHPDKRPDDPDAHHNFLKLDASYKILMDQKARQSFHDKMMTSRTRKKSQQHSSDSSKRRRKSADVDQREQEACAAYTAAKQARDMEDDIRACNQQIIARIKRDAASKAPPVAVATLNKRRAKEADSTQCPCGHCQGAHCLDREVSSNFSSGDGFEAYQNSLLEKFRMKDINNDIAKQQDL